MKDNNWINNKINELRYKQIPLSQGDSDEDITFMEYESQIELLKEMLN